MFFPTSSSDTCKSAPNTKSGMNTHRMPKATWQRSKFDTSKVNMSKRVTLSILKWIIKYCMKSSSTYFLSSSDLSWSLSPHWFSTWISKPSSWRVFSPLRFTIASAAALMRISQWLFVDFLEMNNRKLKPMKPWSSYCIDGMAITGHKTQRKMNPNYKKNLVQYQFSCRVSFFAYHIPVSSRETWENIWNPIKHVCWPSMYGIPY